MKISVITITLNRRDMLERAILSVIDQKYNDYEHIIIDGGSTDGTVELLRSYPHLKWISECDNGQANAMNKGINLASGDVLAWLNSDDTYPPNTLIKVAKYFLDNSPVGIVYGLCNIVNVDGLIIGQSNFHIFDFRRIVMGFNNINTPSTFARLDAIRSEGDFNESLRATYDIDMWIRVAQSWEVIPVRDYFSNLCLHRGSGLVGAKNHLVEIPILRKKYWHSPTIWEMVVRYPLLSIQAKLYDALKFTRLAKKAVASELNGQTR